MEELVKIAFKLAQDEDGYPPVDYEFLWARPLQNGNYIIDNIPFYVTGISAEDEVSTVNNDGILSFNDMIVASGISTFRIIPADSSTIDAVRKDIEMLGCKSECDAKIGLIAAEISASKSINPFLDYLIDGKEKGFLDFDEGVLRHKIF